MKLRRSGALGAILTISLITAGNSAFAVGALKQAYVSTAGANAPDCGAANTPCRTFQFALDNAVAPDGVLYIQTAGDYGPANITRPVTIVNVSGGVAGVLNFAGAQEGVSIQMMTSDRAILQGLTVDGGGGDARGISVRSGNASIVACDVLNVFSGIVVSPSGSTASRALIHDTRVTRATNTGIVAAFGSRGYAEASAYNISVTHSGIGATGLSVNDSLLSENAIGLEGAVNADNVKLTGNDKGFVPRQTSGGTGITFATLSRMTIAGNRIGVEVNNHQFGFPQTLYTYKNNIIEGNAEGDIVGDTTRLTTIKIQ